MISEISTPAEVIAHHAIDRGPLKYAGLLDRIFIERIEQEGPQHRAEPMMSGDVETSLGRLTTAAGSRSRINSRSTYFNRLPWIFRFSGSLPANSTIR